MTIYAIFINLLTEANDETVDDKEHHRRVDFLYAWKHGVTDARNCLDVDEMFFNGDYYYMELGVDRPMCCGLFLDWEHKPALVDARMESKK